MTLPKNLALIKEQIEGYAREYGLNFFETIFEMLDFEQINEVASYGGFPTRYPHWRFGMEYDRMSKGYTYGLQKIYEMVINNDPCYAYLLNSNNLVDQKIVIGHVYAHCDFFKNNYWFSCTNRKMMDEMANHSTRVKQYIEQFGEEAVEMFLDTCLSIENLIDIHRPFIKREEEKKMRPEEEKDLKDRFAKYRLKSKLYMDYYINPHEFLEQMDADEQKKKEDHEKTRKFPENPQQDVLLFLLHYAPLTNWQADILSIIREESYYFAPQGQTKIMNEGWACAVADTRVYTDAGLLSLQEIVDNKLAVQVSDGQELKKVYDYAKFPKHKTIKITTRRGFILEGSKTHQLWHADGSWKRLDESKVEDKIKIGYGLNIWSSNFYTLNWEQKQRLTLLEIAQKANVSLDTVLRCKEGKKIVKNADEVIKGVEEYNENINSVGLIQNKRRKSIKIPQIVNEKLGAFLGYLIGDGHISIVKRVFGLTTGDYVQAKDFAKLGFELFGLDARLKQDNNKWRVNFYSQDCIDFLRDLGLTTGKSARIKNIPCCILKSPCSVVKAFLRAYFDCDGYAGKQGIILSTASEEISKKVQLLLLNFGILSRKRLQKDGCWHIHITSDSAKKFAKFIGFGLQRKQIALEEYLKKRQWFKKEEWEDEIVFIEHGIEDVYDISVKDTHRYAGGGLINHNSYWHSKIMTERAADASEIIDFADHHSGTVAMSQGRVNPYKVGLELFRDIEDRWNKGKFGKEYEECENYVEKKNWNKVLWQGRNKIFEVRKIYNDVMFIDEFLTEEFCKDHKMFAYRYNKNTEMYEIDSREFKKIKTMLLFSLTNFGQPFITVHDGNYGNKGELYITHTHEGIDLKIDWAKETLKNLYTIWKRPVNFETVVQSKKKLFRFDGEEHTDKNL